MFCAVVAVTLPQIPSPVPTVLPARDASLPTTTRSAYPGWMISLPCPHNIVCQRPSPSLHCQRTARPSHWFGVFFRGGRSPSNWRVRKTLFFDPGQNFFRLCVLIPQLCLLWQWKDVLCLRTENRQSVFLETCWNTVLTRVLAWDTSLSCAAFVSGVRLAHSKLQIWMALGRLVSRVKTSREWLRQIIFCFVYLQNENFLECTGSLFFVFRNSMTESTDS